MLEWTGTGSLHVLETAGDSGLELVESEEVKFVMYLVNCHLVRSVNDTEIPILLHSSWTPINIVIAVTMIECIFILVIVRQLKYVEGLTTMGHED